MRTQDIAGDPEAPVDQLQETQRVPVQPVTTKTSPVC